ncbi:MAG: hypothetical protein R2699_04495 [Acidimicrobiales bacterium]
MLLAVGIAGGVFVSSTLAAAAGVLPAPVQAVFAGAADAVGISLPRPDPERPEAPAEGGVDAGADAPDASTTTVQTAPSTTTPPRP